MPTTRPTRRTLLVCGGVVAGAALFAAAGVALALPSPNADDDPKADTAVNATATDTKTDAAKTDAEKVDWKAIPEAEWKERLTKEEYRVLRKQGTERAGTSELNKVKEPGTFTCAACEFPLFKTETKFESGTGWPSFYQPIDGVKSEHVGERDDSSFFMTRTEVHCERCGGHLGHVFKDGPKPTGLRYCINGVSMDFEPAKKEGAEKE